jgi:hypothetical protein
VYSEPHQISIKGAEQIEGARRAIGRGMKI